MFSAKINIILNQLRNFNLNTISFEVSNEQKKSMPRLAALQPFAHFV